MDKLKKGVSVVPDFVSGEQPPAQKFTAIGAQLDYATGELEKAVGDIHSESWPYSTATTTRLSPAWGQSRIAANPLIGAQERSLDIANLGRLIGPAANLNPEMLERSLVEESVPVTVKEFSLRYVPEDHTSLTFSESTVFATFVADPSDIASAGDWSATPAGKVYCFSNPTGGTVQYFTDPTTYAGGANHQNARFNVIPDPNQTSSAGANIAFSGPDALGRFTAVLPVVSHQGSNIDGTDIATGPLDLNDGVQLLLPKVLVDNFSPGEVIPSGFLYLRNNSTNESYLNATYTYNGSTSVLVGGVDLTNAISAGDRFSIITVGSDITSVLADVRTKAFQANHDRTFGEPFIPVGALSGVLSNPGSSGIFVPSKMASNHFPQYLHRDGYTATESGLNDKNILRGDLVVGSSTESAGAKYSSVGESYKVVLGDHTGPSLYKDATHDLQITTTSGRHIDLAAPTYVSGHLAGRPSSLGTERNVAFNSAVFGSEDFNVWEIKNNGTGLGANSWDKFGTNGTWVKPRFEVLHYAEDDVAFDKKDNDTTVANSPKTFDYWEKTFSFPDIPNPLGGFGAVTPLNINDVLGVSVLVKSSKRYNLNSPGDTWYPAVLDFKRGNENGTDPLSPRNGVGGNKIIGGVQVSYELKMDDPATRGSGVIIIRVSHADYASNPFVDPNATTSDNIKISVKINLILASRGTDL